MKNINKPLLVLFLLILSSLAGYSQTCTLNVSISSTATTICSGKSVTLTANLTGGTGPFTYIWNTGENTASIDVNKAGTYTVTVSDKTPGCQPKVTSIQVTSVASPNPPTVDNQIVCPNTAATLTAKAPGGTYQWYDANGNFLFTGNPYVTDPITQGTIFYVETTVGSCTSTRSAVVVNVTGRPSIQSDPVCYGTSATLIASGADSYAWYSNASGTGTPLSNDATFNTPALFTNTTYYLFTVIKGCASSGIPVVARINAPPAVPVVGPGTSVCSGSSITLHADANGVVEWYDVPSGGSPLISSPDYTTPVLTAPITYYVQTRVGDCTSNRIAVPVSVAPIPAAPPSQSPVACYGTSITLTADPSPTGTYAWYTAATGGNPVGIGNTFNTPVLTSNTTYYVERSNGTCTSDRTPVPVTITPAPEPPIVSDGPVICNGTSTSLTATSTQGGTFQWFTTATGGTAIFSGDTFITPALTATTTYYVQTTVGTCISDRSAITVTLLDPIPAPVSPGTAICSGTSATLTATGSPDDYEWYDQPTGGTLLVTGNTYVTPELTANTTYYVQSIANKCNGPRTAVTVKINQPPVAPSVNGTATVCPGQSATLSVPASGETIEWYTDATGGVPVHTGNVYTTSPLFAQTTFYAQAGNGTCISPRTAYTVSTTPIIDPQFQYPSGTICTSGSNVVPVIYNPAGGTFSASSSGLVFVSKTTGEINVAASAVGKYTVFFTYGGTCPGTASQSISIVITPNASFSYNTPICNDVPNPLPAFAAGASAGVFSEASGNLVFKNASTGEIDLDKTPAGTYTITNTIAASGGCAQSINTGTITIYDKVDINAGPTQTVQQGDPVPLGGSIKGGIFTGKWTGGAGTFSDPRKKDAIYTPGPGETVAILTLTSDDPAGPCGAKLSRVTIYINPKPAAPTVAAVKPVCIGSTATLVASAPGGTYRWYSDATGGTALKAGPIFTTPPILSDITYYVATTVGGIVSNRTPVLVKAMAPPAAPVVGTDNKVTVCEGQSAILTASGSTGTYTWYNVPVGGSPVKQGNPFPTTPLTINRSYYVETTVNGCISERTKVDVTVTPAPHVTSSGTGEPVCSGTALNYAITADQPGTTFSWDRPAVAGISNPAVTGQTTSSITETLINTNPNGTAVDVTYNITPYLNGCPGPVFTYKVTINATPVVINPGHDPICNGTSTNYQVKFNTPATSFTWSRAAVTGISNAAVSGQASPIIKEVLFNTTNEPVVVTYVFNFKTSTCPGTPYELKVTVNPAVLITNPAPLASVMCNNTPLGLTLTSNVSSPTFLWSRPAVPGISNPAVTNQTGNTINEALVNTLTTALQVPYTITPMAFGCAGTPVTYTVIVRPETLKPDGHSNSPVCEGNNIVLSTQTVAGAEYLWTGPNNYQSTDPSPTIPNATAANAGTYNLYLIINKCPGEPFPVHVEVDPTPIVDAGPSHNVCISAPFIQLEGSVQSATRTGIWTGGANGGFSKQDNPKGQYFPSIEDRNAGSVTLTLTSTGKDFCPVSKDVTFKFAPSPGADAGPPSIDNVCNETPMVPLSGQPLSGTTVKWTSASGLGKFIPSDDVYNPTFQPDPIDIAKGFVKLTLRATQADDCHTPTDDITINFVPPPTVQADAAGDTRYVLKDHTITLNPVVGSENVTYEWTPTTGLDNPAVKNPVVTGDQDIIYELKITDKSNGCVNKSHVAVKVSPVINISNTFTPNGDGANDYWEIKGLVAYENCTVDVFNRYGQLLFHSVGYPKPWDGTFQGKQVPSGTYYYVVNTKMNNQVFSGYVVILR
ncbi:PKD-like domain-containing protein [Mucilaginibacter angelicae]|uniref:PKD-like domain-containing protein n=1 Tax=Mucilaginibacter angelicae TaxID=869718 RepID=A0ABV6LHE2_9SPHI